MVLQEGPGKEIKHDRPGRDMGASTYKTKAIWAAIIDDGSLSHATKQRVLVPPAAAERETTRESQGQRGPREASKALNLKHSPHGPPAYSSAERRRHRATDGAWGRMHA